MGCNNSKIKKQLYVDIAKSFDSLYSEIYLSGAINFNDKIQRELTGGYAPKEYLDRLHETYKAFIVDTAVQIRMSKQSIAKGKFTAKNSPGPLIDQL